MLVNLGPDGGMDLWEARRRMFPRRATVVCGALALALACNPYPRIACTPGALEACFGTDISFRRLGGDSTLIIIRVQNLQGTITEDNSAWSQLLYIRVYRNTNPSLGFPADGPVLPTWDATVQTLGPAPPGSGWRNVGVNSPSFVNEWTAAGGTYGTNVGYVSGRDSTYNQVVKAGAGLRTYTGPGKAPGWVTFTFVAHRPISSSDVGIQLSAWASLQSASMLPPPEQVGCQLVKGGGPISSDCVFHLYNLPP
jgi:hypothetical protein